MAPALQLVTKDNVDDIAALKQDRVIIASSKAVEFEREFANQINKTAFIFSSVAGAFACWLDLIGTSQAKVIVLADYAALGDGQVGADLAKLIRRAEKEAGLDEGCDIYLMADNPTPINEVLAKRFGATGVIQKSPAVVQQSFGKASAATAPDSPIETEVSVSQEEPAQQKGPTKNNFFELNPQLGERIEFFNGVLRRFIGAAAAKVSADAFELMSEGKIAPTEQSYTQYLASRIPSEEMKQGFLHTVKSK